MQKKHLWIVAAVVLLATGAVLFLSQQKKGALAKWEKAQVAYRQGDHEEVVQLLTQAKWIQRDLRGERGVTMAQSYEALGQVDSAKKIWEKLLTQAKIEPSIQDLARFKLLLLNQERTTEKDIATLEKLIENSQNQEVVAGSLLELGKHEKASGNLLLAQQNFKKIIPLNSSYLSEALQHLGEINTRLLFSKKQTPHSKFHVVKSGESLASIAKKHKMSVELLIESNGLSSETIHPQDRLKVNTAKFSILINKKENTLTLLANKELFKIYSVGTGKEGSTPIGNFKVTSKLVEPTWYHPDGGVIPFGDKENLLGSRWLGINSPGYGIHGTWESESIGKQSSAGCVRMLNPQVEEIFKIVTIGTPVTIVE